MAVDPPGLRPDPLNLAIARKIGPLEKSVVLMATMGTVPIAWFVWIVALGGWAIRTVPGLGATKPGKVRLAQSPNVIIR